MAELPIKEENNPSRRPHLSASSLKTYLDCQLMFRFRYVDKIKTPQSWRAEFGKVWHATLEDDLKGILEGRKPLTVDELDERFADHLEHSIIEIGMTPDLRADFGTLDFALEGLQKEGHALAKLYTAEIQKHLRPLAVEMEFRWAAGREWDYIGYIDLLQHWGAQEKVTDFKTSRSQRKLDPEQWLQGTIYAAWREHMTGEIPFLVELVRFNRRNRSPYIDFARTTRSPEEIESVIELGEATVSGIKMDIFQPTGLGTGRCHYCDYADRCEPRQAYLLEQEAYAAGVDLDLTEHYRTADEMAEKDWR